MSSLYIFFLMEKFYDMIYKTMNATCDKNILTACRPRYFVTNYMSVNAVRKR